VGKKMTRREALALGGVAAAAMLGTRAARGQEGGTTPPKILYVMTDDQPRHMASARIMPKLDTHLRAKGIDFVRAYVSEPLCGPARASLFKGQYSHNTGILGNRGAYQDFKERGLDQDTLATRLRAVGYKTAHFGKYMNGYQSDKKYVPPGWFRWFTYATGQSNPDYYKMSQASRGSTTARVKTYYRSEQNEIDLLAARVEDFIRPSADIPWLAYVGFQSPHDPYYPAPRHEHYADGATYSSPGTEENTLEELSDKPQNVRDQAPWTTEEQAKADWHTEGKLEKLQAVDEAIEHLVLALKETGQLANTLIVFCTDNGYMLGEHGLLQKAAPYEEATSVPFVVRGPGVTRGIESDALVSQLDITATMLDLAGADTSGIDGRSLVPLFAGTTPDDWRKRLLVEQKDVGWEMLREGDYSYTERSTGERELYDLASDPYELQSLHDDPTQLARVQAFSENLGRLRNAVGDGLRAAEV
jgi:N-acetylglucosamine-6-sulfatase